jgi:hypothetical protein
MKSAMAEMDNIKNGVEEKERDTGSGLWCTYSTQSTVHRPMYHAIFIQYIITF